MQTFKPTGTERAKLRDIASALKRANTQLAKAKKAVDAAKDHFATWLKKTHNLELESLDIGELVQIEDVLLVEVGKRNKFNERAFSLAEPSLYSEWRKDFPVLNFKPLV